MVEKNNLDPLAELYTDALSEIDPFTLTAILKPYVKINKETKNIIFTDKGIQITANNKIILFFLVKKLLYMQKVIEIEMATPREVKEALKSVPSGTIDAAIKYLSEKGPLKGKDGKYIIPDFNIKQVEDIFSKLGRIK
jgi:hypothetical protein